MLYGEDKMENFFTEIRMILKNAITLHAMNRMHFYNSHL
ncbi:hypothetical protein T12_10367 [Trichinella patagoniensis]|uniref:Uncharacterized protein n=1 Tax=Trichinella patagoniensis TaxID=990121 RepID=A0A0V0YRG6_9BILA|nr:hypothetical protein T12_10367 [Trichinella patagoniensis]